MNRQAQAVIMLLFGGAILKASLSDLYLRYVKEGLRPFLIGAGILLVAAAVLTLWYELRGRTDRHDDGHGHHHEPRVGWLLLLPVLGLLLVAPPALGSYAAGQSGTVLTAPGDSDYPALPAGDPVDVGLLDYASRAVFDGGRSLTGRTVRLTGFVTPGPDGEPMLARMVVSCCAADGRPIKVGLDGDTRVTAAPDTWVQVVGVWTNRVAKDPVNQAEVPYLQVTGWQEITAPKQQYE
ncbi:TIGR03943 family putative permease subunit [Amorphoplanes digitatis]|uniref:Putative repeat protein (TIGR03943 family) n=1 Tax=Actinoplanes digitatis TaxID=1868 RepID=A0A7W7HXI6_9ACTN|nr:TIGR03943 family protein [Actinoplanes digitatis]MBB4762597.1 putative repeat protein (TIGR03943 family) [Actinoplanes digitatis]GID91902.1 membrane protein [Actinoplanes digitatis]